MPGTTKDPQLNKILYVDDEQGMLEIGKIFLEEDGPFTVDTLPSAIKALDHLKSTHYDAVVSDYQMPKMDGITFLKTLRAGGDTTPFVIFTGKGREDVVIEALNSGADFYLQKGGEPVPQFTELAHKLLHAISRRHANLALKKSEQDYRHLIEHAGEAIFVTQDEVFKMVNPQIIHLSGHSEQELLNQPFTRFVHPDDANTLLENFRKRIAGSDNLPSHYFFRIFRKDGALRWVELNVVGITWDEHPAILNFMTDITDRKHAEDGLRESEERYRHLIEHAGEGIYVVQDGNLQMVNPRTTDMCGYTEEELIGKPFKNFVHPDDFGVLIDRFRRRINGETLPSRYSFRIYHKDGTIRWVELSVVAIDWNGAPATLNYVTDINDRKLAEDALRESEERYRQFFRTTLDSVFISSPEGKWIDFNDATVKIFGYASREEISGVAIPALWANPEGRGAFLRTVEEIGYIKEQPILFKKRDGTIFDAVVTIVPLKKPDGSVKAFIGTIRDITDRKRAEDALRESEERYRQFFRTTLDSVFITTPEGRFIDFNDALLAMHGYRNRDEMLTIDVATTYAYPEERSALLELVRQKGEVREHPLRFRKQDGTIIDTLISMVPLKNPDGSIKAFLGTVRDITDRKRAEDALRESEERYRHIFESFEDLYYQTDNNGIITILSPSVFHLTGWTGEELIGKPVTVIYVNPKDRQILLDELTKNGHVRDYEVLLLKKEGTQVLASLSANCICHADGTPAGVAGTLRDISRRKRAEDALRESEEKFRSLVDYALETILIVDLQGTVLFANNAAAHMIEAEKCGDLIGRNVMEFVAPESRGDVTKDFAEVARGHDAYLARYHLVSLKGRDVTVESIGKVITYEGKPVDLISLRDISQKRTD